MISRSGSGPTAAAMSIEWTTSAKRTETCLYSADRVASVSRVPHSPQNLAVGLDSAPQEPQISPVVVGPLSPSPLGFTSASFQCWSTMSALPPLPSPTRSFGLWAQAAGSSPPYTGSPLIHCDVAVLDEVAHAGGAESLPERLHGVADDGRIGTGTHRGRAGHTEQWSDLAEVVAGCGDLEQLFTAGRQLAYDFEFAFGDYVDQVPYAALLEQHGTACKTNRFGLPVDRDQLRHHLDDAVGEREDPGIVRGHHDNPLTRRQLADQPQHLFYLDEVQVRRGFVGQDQRRVQRDRAGDRHPLLLTAAQVTGSVSHPVLQSDARQ